MSSLNHIHATIKEIHKHWGPDNDHRGTRALITGKSRHARRRQNRRQFPVWERCLRHRFTQKFDEEQRREAENHNGGRSARQTAETWLRDLVYASWSWTTNPDFFSDLWAAAVGLGVRTPLQVSSNSLLGPAPRSSGGIVTQSCRIAQRMPYGGLNVN